jgi:NitT/TauT family transport system permease protein
VLVKARVPNAIPYLFTALKIAAPAAVITAFVAEYFGGSQNGLGAPHRLEHRLVENRRRVGLRARRLPARADVLLISICLESITTHNRGLGPGGVHT